MDLDSPLEVVIGPYETYEDGLFGYKAAFEAFVCVEQPGDSAQLAKYKKELPFLESRLPIPDEFKNTKRGSDSPIRVADELITGGDARRGVQTLAFNLPNDERVREAKGSKKVLLKNMMRAKYDAVLRPVAARVLAPDEGTRLDFDSYFHHILFHELSHGLGPGRIKVGGRDTEVRLELKELYPAVEEAKADVLGVYSLAVLANKGVVPVAVVETLPWTYVAGLFRAARFGVSEAHGLGVVIQANYLLDERGDRGHPRRPVQTGAREVRGGDQGAGPRPADDRGAGVVHGRPGAGAAVRDGARADGHAAGVARRRAGGRGPRIRGRERQAGPPLNPLRPGGV